MGACHLCGSSFDDYSSRCRCTHCRMLVLVCDNCRVKGDVYVCELCLKHSKGFGSVPFIEEDNTSQVVSTVASDLELSPQLLRRDGKDTADNSSRGKLRILCLHGFRQNASSFKGRSASLAKKLKNIAELIFIDAPHQLPFIYQPCVPKTHENSQSEHNPPLPPENCRSKYAWFVSPDFDKLGESNWKIAACQFDPLQYQQQTGGFDASLEFLKRVFKEEGPFDGILGFSQGAAMAASVCAQRERLKGEIDFRFVVLCSGFALQSLSEIKPRSINCPSLHVFGSLPGKDRQIGTQASRDLALLFEEGCSVIVEHECGHIIPTRSPYIDEIKGFLKRFN